MTETVKCRHLKSPRSLTVFSASRSHSGCVSHQSTLSTLIPFVPWQSCLPLPRYNLTLKIQGQGSRSKVPQSAQRPAASFPQCFTSGHLIDSRLFRSMTIGPPIPKIKFDRKNSRSKFKVKGTPVSAAFSWLISFVFHIRASYRLCSLLFMTIGPPIPKMQFDLENSRSRVKVKGIPVSPASSCLISLVYHIRASFQLSSLSFHDNRASHSWDTIWPRKFKLKGQGQRSKVKGQRYPSQGSIQLTHFLLFHITWTNHS